MQKSRWVWVGALVVLNLISCNTARAAWQANEGTTRPAVETAHAEVDRLVGHVTPPPAQEAEPVAPGTSDEVHVTLSATHHTTSWDERDAERKKFDLPLLFLHREREAAPEAQRTLNIDIVGTVPGTEITVEALSQHVDVTTGERHAVSQVFATPDHRCSFDALCELEWVLDPATVLSDFYSLRVTDEAGDTLWEDPNPERPDFVVLDTWDVGLSGYAVRIYYATLFPFARGAKNADDRLSPEGVVDFIAGQFVPIIEDTWRRQVEEWGFGQPMQPEWDGDGVVEIVITDPPFALFGGTGTYTVSTVSGGRAYPERRIWWKASFGEFLLYDTLESATKMVFAHEFFHLMQWNTLLSAGRPTNRWHNVFFEAQANFATTLQHPEMEIEKNHLSSRQSEYTRAANRFLSTRLNSSYRDMEADRVHLYDAALYWRFLYEQFRDTGVIRAALEEMALGYDADIVDAMDDVMDKALAQFDGPFHTFEESLAAFARANFALRLANGRCTDPELKECQGRYYDPNHAYLRPRLAAERHYDGSRLLLEGAIASSYGMDFVEVSLDPNVHNQALIISFQGKGQSTRFNVQIWKLMADEGKLRAITPVPEVIPQNGDKDQVLVISQVDGRTYDRLALIITRLDSDETADPVGAYHITVESGA
jgi:hypothetical protein